MDNSNTQFVIDWIDRMGFKYGRTVFEEGKAMDWGQALCREIYGKDWMNNPDFQHDCKLDDIPMKAVLAAQKWEAGDVPEWFKEEYND